jgi:5'-3' exonuclease
VYQPVKKQLVTHENFKELIGVETHKFIEYKILVGDKSDNISGISGIGQSTALQLLNSFDSILDAIEAIKNGFEIQTMVKNKILSIDPKELKRLYNLMSLETDRFGARAIAYKHLTSSSATIPMNKRVLFNLGVLIGKYKNLDLQKLNNVIYNRENIIINRW